MNENFQKALNKELNVLRGDEPENNTLENEEIKVDDVAPSTDEEDQDLVWEDVKVDDENAQADAKDNDENLVWEDVNIPSYTTLDAETGKVYSVPVTMDETDTRFAIATQDEKIGKENFIGKVAIPFLYDIAKQVAKKEVEKTIGVKLENVSNVPGAAAAGVYDIATASFQGQMDKWLDYYALSEYAEKGKNENYNLGMPSIGIADLIVPNEVSKVANEARQAVSKADEIERDKNEIAEFFGGVRYTKAELEEAKKNAQELSAKAVKLIDDWRARNKERWENKSNELYPTDERGKKDLPDLMYGISNGATSIAGSIAATLITKNPTLAAAGISKIFYDTTKSEAFQEAKEHGEDFDAADWHSDVLGFIEGGMEGIGDYILMGIGKFGQTSGLSRVMKRSIADAVEKVLAKKSVAAPVKTAIKNVARKSSVFAAGAKGFLSEGLFEETVQNLAEDEYKNFIGWQDKSQGDIFSDALWAGFVGGITGAGAGAFGSALYNRKMNKWNAELKEAVKAYNPDIDEATAQQAADLLQESYLQEGAPVIDELQNMVNKEKDVDALPEGGLDIKSIGEVTRNMMKERFGVSDKEIDEWINMTLPLIDARMQFNEAYQGFYDQLVDAGRGEVEADSSARLIAARLVTRAIQTGKSVNDILNEQWKLKIVNGDAVLESPDQPAETEQQNREQYVDSEEDFPFWQRGMTLYQSMYKSPLKTFEEFYDDVISGNNPKARFRTEIIDNVEMDIPSNALQHDKNDHSLTKEEWQGVIDALNNGKIKEAKMGDVSVMNGFPVKMVVDVNGTDYGVVFEHMEKGRNLVQTAFKLEDKGWINKKSAKMSARYPQTYDVSFGHSLPEIISNLESYVKQDALKNDIVNSTFYQFAGEKAQTAALDQLDQAKQLEAAGTDNEQIRQQTGWFKGVDGKWRFEISDKDAEIDLSVWKQTSRETAKAIDKQIDFYNAEMRRLIKKRDAGDMAQADFEKAYNEAMRLRMEAVDKLNSGKLTPVVKLSEILKHDNLFKAYPELADLKLSFVFFDNFNKMGSYRDDVLYLNEELQSNPKELKSVLMHEVQHAIQHKEGFAVGGSVDMAQRLMETLGLTADIKIEEEKRKYFMSILNDADKVQDILNKQYFYNKSFKELMENPESENLKKQAKEFNQQYFDALEKYGISKEQLALSNNTTTKKLVSFLKRATPHEVYERLFGEVEARNTQARMDMSEEERAAASPESTQDVQNADAIVVFDDGTAMAYDMGGRNQKYEKDIQSHTVTMNNNEYHLIQKENKPKIADDDVTITPVEISKEDVPDMNIGDFATWVMENLEDDFVHIDATNENIGVSKSNIRRGRQKSKSREKQAVLAKIKDLFGRAQYSGFEENDGQLKHKNVDGQDVYHTAMYYDGIPYSIQFKVDNLSNRGDRKYAGHSIEEIKIAPAAERSRNSSGTLVQTDAIYDMSLAVLRGKVKPSNIENGRVYQTGNTRPQGARGSFTRRLDTGEAIIELFETADASTIIHELGHFFLDDMKRFADDPTTAEQLQAIYRYVGSADGNLSVEQHEYFARSFEAYLREGKSPNSLLKRVFDDFKTWLKRIYATVKGLNVNLDDDIRKVFDEMLGGKQLDFAMQRGGQNLKTKLERGFISAWNINKAMQLLHDGKMSKADMQELINDLKNGKLEGKDFTEALKKFENSNNINNEKLNEWDYNYFRTQLDNLNFKRDKVKERIMKLLDWTKPRSRGGKMVGRFPYKTMNDAFDHFRELANMNKDEAQEQIDKNKEMLDAFYREGGDIDAEQLIFDNKLLSLATGKISDDTLLELYEALSDSYNQGRLTDKITGEIKKARKQRLINEAKQVLTDGGRINWHIEQRGLKPWVQQKLRNFGRSQMSWSGLLDMLSINDSSSKTNKSLLSQNLDMFEAEQTMYAGIAQDGENISARLEKALAGSTNKAISVNRYMNKELDKETTIEWTGDENLGKRGVRKKPMLMRKTFTKDQLLDIYMKAKDKDTLDIMKADKINQYNDEFLAKVEAELTEDDIAVANALFDFYNDNYDRFNKFYEDHFGISLAHNKYYSPRSMTRNGINVDDGSPRAYASFSGAKQRIAMAGSATINIKGAFAALNKYVQDLNHYIGYSDQLQDINAVMGDKDVKAIIANIFGGGMNARIQYEIENMANSGSNQAKGAGKFWNKVRSNYARSVLAVKPSLAIKQLTSFPAYWENMSTGDFVSGVADFFKHPKEAMKILGNTTLMKTRGTNIIRDFEVMSTTEAFKNMKKSAGKIKWNDLLMANIKFGDRGAIYVGGWALYRAELKKNLAAGMSEAEAKAKALNTFERVTDETQQSGRLSQQSYMQSNSALRAFTMFTSSQNQYLRKEINAVRGLISGRMDKKQVAKTMFIYHFLLPMFFQAVADGFRWDKDAQLRTAALGSLNGWFILNKVLENLYNQVTGQGSMFKANMTVRELVPFWGSMEDIWKDIQKIADGDIEAEDVIKSIKTIGELSGLPLKYATDVALNAGEYADEGEYGKEGLLWLGWSPYSLREFEE